MSQAHAVTVAGLYSVEVPVAGSGPDQLAKGAADGLGRVLVRVSGSRDVLNLDGVPSLLDDAESLLLSYQFLRDDQGNDRLQMSFGAVGVNKALASVDAPVWGANRPLTLAWVAVEERGSRRLVTEGDPGGNESPADSWRAAFKEAAADRGLPLALPPASAAGDRELLSEIWGQFVSNVQSSASNLSHDAMALVRINRSGGQWRAGWVFDGGAANGGEQSVTAATPGELVKAVIDRWTEQYASQYAVSANEVGESPQVDIVIDGVNSVADYGGVTGVLEGLTPVQEVSAARVKGSQLTLRATFTGELDQLKQYIALDSRFVAMDPGSVAPKALEKTGSQAAAKDASESGAETSANEVAGSPDAVSPSGNGADVKDKGVASTTFTYQPLAKDKADASQAFDSLYQVLYYRWQPAPNIGTEPGQ
ncbi:hypothetical protein MSNKSG1_04126 [Marinobacter santoriniensis NKSG1]|uniref:DUF2066 domain-containing protein n=1 Tax=Marinobacter santoriniensis NKSG1 TaxID=1288826 RepID=M7CWA2_9GAMM|nr:hypothetical protein MSNKSG1_04126 [Marinobacter santoriniensis NKSG1]